MLMKRVIPYSTIILTDHSHAGNPTLHGVMLPIKIKGHLFCCVGFGKTGVVVSIVNVFTQMPS